MTYFFHGRDASVVKPTKNKTQNVGKNREMEKGKERQHSQAVPLEAEDMMGMQSVT